MTDADVQHEPSRAFCIDLPHDDDYEDYRITGSEEAACCVAACIARLIATWSCACWVYVRWRIPLLRPQVTRTAGAALGRQLLRAIE